MISVRSTVKTEITTETLTDLDQTNVYLHSCDFVGLYMFQFTFAVFWTCHEHIMNLVGLEHIFS